MYILKNAAASAAVSFAVRPAAAAVEQGECPTEASAITVKVLALNRTDT